MYESYEDSYHKQERHEVSGRMMHESAFKPALHVDGVPAADFVVDQEVVDESVISEQSYVGSASIESSDQSGVLSQFEKIKDRVIGKDVSVEDWLTLHKRMHYFVPAPSKEEVYCKIIGCKQENLHNTSKSHPLIMRNLIYYAFMQCMKDDKIYSFDDIKISINNREYSYPSGSKDLSVIEIGLKKTIHAPKFFHVRAKTKDGKIVIVNLYTDYNSVEMSLHSNNLKNMEDFTDWFDAQVDKYNFLKGAKIDGATRFLDIDKNMDWDRIVLPPGVREKFERDILTMFSKQHIYDANGVPPKAGAALLGPPGTGKTTLIKILASKLDGVTVIVVSPDNLSGGASSVKGIYGMANKLSPSLVVWEDCDVHLGDRGSYQSGGGVLSEVMNMLDGIVPLKNVVTLISSNRPQALEQALINRPGRIDCKIYLGPPDDLGRFDLLARYFKKVKSNPEDVKKVAKDERIKKFTPCYIEELAKRSIKKAISEGRYDKNSLIASVTYDDISYSIDEILKELSLDGDYTKFTVAAVAMEDTGIDNAIIESLHGFGDINEARTLKKVESYMKLFLGDDDIDFRQTISRRRRPEVISLLDDTTQLRRLGVKRSSIAIASKLADDPDSTYRDIATVLSGGK